MGTSDASFVAPWLGVAVSSIVGFSEGDSVGLFDGD